MVRWVHNAFQCDPITMRGFENLNPSRLARFTRLFAASV